MRRRLVALLIWIGRLAVCETENSGAGSAGADWSLAAAFRLSRGAAALRLDDAARAAGAFPRFGCLGRAGFGFVTEHVDSLPGERWRGRGSYGSGSRLGRCYLDCPSAAYGYQYPFAFALVRGLAALTKFCAGGTRDSFVPRPSESLHTACEECLPRDAVQSLGSPP